MDELKQIAIAHFMAVPAVAAFLAACAARIDGIILFTLRFFPPEKINAEIERLAAKGEARVNKDAGTVAPKP